MLYLILTAILGDGNYPKITVSKLGNIPTLGNGEPKSGDESDSSGIPPDRIGREQTRGPPGCEGASEKEGKSINCGY